MQAGQPLAGLGGWVVGVIDSVGAVGVGVLIALANVFPPIPSEIILPFAGFSASQGTSNPVWAWVCATVGALVGAYVLYAVGTVIGRDRVHELAGKRWFVLFSQSDLERGERFFDGHGGKVVLIGRFLPFIRSVVSVPAGFARMPLVPFTCLTALGSGIWNALFIYAGFQLGARWQQVGQYVAPVSYAVLALLAVGVIVLLLRRRQQPT